jgi:hypothetical protein
METVVVVKLSLLSLPWILKLIPLSALQKVEMERFVPKYIARFVDGLILQKCNVSNIHVLQHIATVVKLVTTKTLKNIPLARAHKSKNIFIYRDSVRKECIERG